MEGEDAVAESVNVVFNPFAHKIRHEDELRRGKTNSLFNIVDFPKNGTNFEVNSPLGTS